MKELVCIGCPRGCRIKIDEETLQTQGNACARGEAYARDELTHPTRTLTSTVKISHAAIRRCPVKTDRPIPKDMVQQAAAALDEVTLAAPVRVGDVAIENILGTGANVVCARTLEKIDE